MSLRVHSHVDSCSSCFLRSRPPLHGRQPPSSPVHSALLTLGAGPLPHLSNPAAVPQRTPSSDSFTPCPLSAGSLCLRCLSREMAQHQSASRKKTALAAVCCASVGHFLLITAEEVSLRLRGLEVLSNITVRLLIYLCFYFSLIRIFIFESPGSGCVLMLIVVIL